MYMSNHVKNFRCALCGFQASKTILKITKPDRFEIAQGISEKDYIRYWVECLGCGVASNVNFPQNVELLRSLSSSYYDVDFQSCSIADKYTEVMAMPPEKSDNTQRVFRIRDFAQKWFKNSKRNIKTPLTIIDIGAGTGVFLSRFIEECTKEAMTFKGVALEPDPSACRHLRSLSKFEVKEVAFSGQPEFSNYDLCTLNKVIEHIEYPVAFMRDIKNVLSKDMGLLYVEVPDMMTIFHRPASDNILGSLHFHLYDFRSLTYLLTVSDLVPLQMLRLLEPSGKKTMAAFATLPSTFNCLAESGGLW